MGGHTKAVIADSLPAALLAASWVIADMATLQATVGDS